MSGEKIRVTGLKSVVRQLKKLDVELVVTIKELNLRAAAAIASAARQRAPRLSGKLGASIKAGSTRTVGYVKAGGAAIPYANAIHWGWPAHNIAPQKFLVEALDAEAPAVLAAYERDIHRLIVRNFGRL